MIIYTDGTVEVKAGTPTPPPPGAARSAVIYDQGKSVEVRLASQESLPVVHAFPVTYPLFCFVDWHAGRYRRYGTLRVLELPTERLRVVYTNPGGAEVNFPLGTYTLKFDGVAVVTTTVSAATTRFYFDIPTNGLPVGWRIATGHGPNGMTSLPFPVFVNPGGNAVPAHAMPVMPISHDMVMDKEPFAYAFCPGRFTPTPRPLVARECPPFATALTPDKFYRTNLVPQRGRGVLRPNITPDGVMSCFNKMPYIYEDNFPYPLQHVLDGPRGYASIDSPTHIMPDRHGGAYCTTLNSVRRVSPTGEVRTRAGVVQVGPPGQYQIPDKLKRAYDTAISNQQWETAADRLYEIFNHLRVRLVGDWSGCPRRYHGFQEMWGAAFWQETLALDPNAPPQGGEQPHLVDPQLFVTGSRNNAAYRLTFSKNSFETEPRVTLFHADLAHPFDVVERNGRVYISERDAGRIGIYSASDGALINYLRTGLSLPEGLFIQDDWLYFSTRVGKVSGKIERINLVTDAQEFVCNVTEISLYIKFAVSDGTFGPRGTVFYTTWDLGWPTAVLPGGALWKYIGNSSPLAGGKGGQWATLGYMATVGVGMGRLFFGSAHEGLVMLSQALPTDQSIDIGKYTAGFNEYIADSNRLLYGDNTFGYYGFPLPWGESANKDYYMQHCTV